MRPPLRHASAVFSLVATLAIRAAGAEPAPAMEHPPELLEADRALAAWGAVPIFFPPEPPPLWNVEASLAFNRWESYGYLRAPPELAPFVGEPFYPALGTLLATHELGTWSRRRLEDYRAAKLKLQTELRAELLRGREAAPEARRTRLLAFAREQTPKIAALERTAERLRTSLTKIDYRWGVLRTEYLGQDSRHPDSAALVADVMQAAAYYEGGLLPTQRRFLREIAIEVPLAADTVEQAVAAHPYVFFSPSLARIRWPDDAPPGVTRKIADYQARRSALKKELYDVVFKADSTWLAIVRNVQFRISLGPQAAKLDQLETLAEDIRCDLAQRPDPPAPSRWPIPPALIQRLGVMLEGQRLLSTGARHAIEAVRKREPALDINYGFEPGGLQFDVRPRSHFLLGASADAKRRSDFARAEIAGIAAAHRRALAELLSERAAIRLDLARALNLDDAREFEAALATAARLAFEQEADGPFRAYRNAVFEPGLSPEQRRLLFDSAIEQLGLPLPSGEYQPQ